MRRIFLAEDNAADVLLVREALKRHSVSCELAVYPNAQAAILAAERCGLDGYPTPDLILVDLNLPWGHGCDVLEAAAKNPAITTLTASFPPVGGAHDLCFVFAYRGHDPLWAIDKVRLVPAH